MLLGISSSAVFALLGLYIDYKERKSIKILRDAAAKDSLWDLDQMKMLARATLYKIDAAWRDKDPSVMENYLELGFYLKLKDKIENDSFKDGKYSGLESIDETRIICCQDYLNNEEDKFVAYTKGMASNGDKSWEFTTTLHFLRQGNNWLLYKIHYGMAIWDLLLTRNIEEM